MRTREMLFDDIREGKDRNITDFSTLGDCRADMFSGLSKEAGTLVKFFSDITISSH